MTRGLGAFALLATLGADPITSTKVMPGLVHVEPQAVTITTAPLSAHGPVQRMPLAVATTSALDVSRLAPASLSAGGTLTTATLSAFAPGGFITTPTLSAFAPGGTFTLPVARLSAVAPKSGTSTRIVGTIAESSLVASLAATSGGGTIATDGLSVTAPGGIVTTSLLSAYAPTVTGAPNALRGPVIGPTGVRLSSAGSDGGTFATVPLMANAPGGTIATASLSAVAPGGTFGVLVSPLLAGAPAHGGSAGELTAVLNRPNLALPLSAAVPGGGTFPTQPLTANAPGGVITTSPLNANAPTP
jgi:hypothetical protein